MYIQVLRTNTVQNVCGPVWRKSGLIGISNLFISYLQFLFTLSCFILTFSLWGRQECCCCKEPKSKCCIKMLLSRYKLGLCTWLIILFRTSHYFILENQNNRLCGRLGLYMNNGHCSTIKIRSTGILFRSKLFTVKAIHSK